MNDSFHISQFYSIVGNQIRCDICPRYCILGENQRGLCFVRKNSDGKLVLTTYGKSSGFAVDPIEKKPLYHFYPGSSVLSFGTAGCNLTCKFCQNWDISKSDKIDILQASASPKQIANSALKRGCKSVAFTYNDPVIFMEYAVDTAVACHELGIKTVAVTAGYVNSEPAKFFFQHMDAVNVDLKGFTDHFYKKLCSAQLQPILDILRFIVNIPDCWLEITNLLIPDHNDSDEEISTMCQWIKDNLGQSVPIHFSAFHPAYKMKNVNYTPVITLLRAEQIARSVGLHNVYLGNIRTDHGQNSLCTNCGQVIIKRVGYQIEKYEIQKGKCKFCHARYEGIFN
ncbi:MAG: AmmeMemoRadiSam system radical SAM enzyme [Fidelibacterota bacterium]